MVPFFSKKGDLKKKLLQEAHITVLVILITTLFPIYWITGTDIPGEFLIGFQRKLIPIIFGVFLICFAIASAIAIRRAGTILNSIERIREASLQDYVNQNRSIMADLQLAGNIQQKLLPTLYPSFPGINFSWEMLPGNYVAGDMFNVFPLDDNNIGVYILDVKGHGISAALKAVSVSYLIKPSARPKSCIDGRDLDWHIFRPSETIQHLNERFKSESGKNFLTMFYGVYNTLTMELTYSIAGHHPPIVFSEHGYPRILNKGGPAIGLIPNSDYRDYTIKLRVGDKVLLYTDGVTEAEDLDDNFFGLDKLLNIINLNKVKSVAEITSLVKDEVIVHLGDRAVYDDISILAFEITQESPVTTKKVSGGI